MSKIYQPSEVTLVYEFPSGTNAEQLVSDVVDIGTLIDPDNGDDGKIVRVIIDEQEYDPAHVKAVYINGRAQLVADFVDVGILIDDEGYDTEIIDVLLKA